MSKSTSIPKEDTFPTHTFPTPASFTTFLSHHSTTLPGLFLKLAKKSSGIPSITAAEAVECALCYGWIDGRANSIDENYWTVRYTPRRKNSIWSKKNVESVGRLVEEGRMREGGLRVVEEARGNGRWEKAYGGGGELVVPRDLEVVLEGDEVVRGVWEGLGRQEKSAVLFRLGNVSDKGRGKCLNSIVEKLREGEGAKTVNREKGKEVEKKGRLVKGEKPSGVAKRAVSKKTTVRKQVILKEEPEIMASAEKEEAAPSRREGLRRRT